MSTRATPAARVPRRQAGVLLLWWLGITAVVLLVGLLLDGPVGDVVGDEDEAVPRWFAAHRTPLLTRAADAVTLVGDTFVALGAAVVVMALLWWWLHRWGPVVFVAVAGAGELATYLLTVNVVHRPRPSVPRLDPGLDPLHSYPSGHVAGAMATYGGLAVVLWVARRRWRWASPLLFGVVALIAVARLYMGVHHPSDLLTSIGFMAFWLHRCAVVLLDPVPLDPVLDDPVGRGSGDGVSRGS